MFGLMKNLIKETQAPSETISLSELFAGCVLGFGFMPQKNISGKRISIAEVNSYLFETDNFIVYKLESDSAEINLIVANEDDAPGNYLALSQRIEPRQFSSVFIDTAPEAWFALKEGDLVDVNEDVLGPLSGWLAAEYTLAVITKGRFFEGDYRLRKAADRVRLSRPFDYLLLVDDDNEYALEVEKYEDGTLSVLATIYRPSTDIGEIARAPKAATSSVTSSSEAVPMPLSFAVEKIAHEPPMTPAISKPKDESVAESETETEALKDDKQIAPTSPATGPKLVIKDEIDLKTETKADEKLPLVVETAEPEIVSSDTVQDFTVPPLPVTAETKTIEPVALSSVAIVDSAEAVAPAGLKENSPELLNAPEITPPETAAEKPEGMSTEASFKALAKEISKPQDRSQPVPAAAFEAVPARSKFGRIHFMSAAEAEDVLACDLPLAARLIDEAQRNQMPISEVIRKVIDLPGRINDQILIPFAIDSSEQVELARRYQLPANDKDAVKQHIIEELKRFAGDKK